ncbi:MAG: enoyl-CoA hydratase [Opitutus sp.]|nr:enoyl-CoA hydratase [Opitutus sp.]
MSDGHVHYAVSNGVATVRFDRPEARNAMTWSMYAELASACAALAADASVRVAVFRGTGEAFVAGTDIGQFTTFQGADDGVAYERKIDAAIEQIEKLAMPTIAVVEGWCMGGGLAIATACDFRIATPAARFGVPIARTLGNCLSVANVARLMAAFGAPRTKRMLLLAESVPGEEAAACGYVEKLVASDEVAATVDAMCGRLVAHAPLTMRAAKEAIRRITIANLPDGEDLVRACYGSADFKEGVASFLAKRRPEWRGR